MFFLFGRLGSRLVVVAVSVLWLLGSCRPTHYAYFQPQVNSIPHVANSTVVINVATDTVSPKTTDYAEVVAVPATSQTTPSANATTQLTPSVVRLSRHRNPDSYQNQRINRWLRSANVGHVAPKTQLIDRHSRSRKTYPLAWVALGLGVLSAGAMFIVSGGTLMWILGITVPLSATLLGVASMTTIKRNQDRYRGKGWAMAAIMLGTGVLGLALIALAALSVSETINR